MLLGLHSCDTQCRGLHSRSATQPALARCFSACASSLLASRRTGAISCNTSGRGEVSEPACP
eukprot:2460973-Pyramimonas_sp.AAC.1